MVQLHLVYDGFSVQPLQNLRPKSNGLLPNSFSGVILVRLDQPGVEQTHMELVKRASSHIARTAFVRQALNEPVNFRDLKRKPSPKLWLAVGMILLSYLTCWPIIAVLAVSAFKFNNPLIFSVGSPCAYVFSHVLLLAGMLTAGSEGLGYFRSFLLWLVGYLLRSSFIRSFFPQTKA